MEVRHGRVPVRTGMWIDVTQETVFATALLLPIVLGAFLFLSSPPVPISTGRVSVTSNVAPASRSVPPRLTAVASPTIAPLPPVPALARQPIEATPITQVAVATPTSAPPTATVEASTPTPIPVGHVANTSGDGVFLRHTPFLSDRWIAWPDKTPLIVLGIETISDGQTWLQVRDPKNNVGWVPAQYVAR